MFGFTINNLNENIHKMHYLKDLFRSRQLSISVQFSPLDPIQSIWFTLVFQSTLVQFSLIRSTQSVSVHFGLIRPYTYSFLYVSFSILGPKIPFFFFNFGSLASASGLNPDPWNSTLCMWAIATLTRQFFSQIGPNPCKRVGSWCSKCQIHCKMYSPLDWGFYMESPLI